MIKRLKPLHIVYLNSYARKYALNGLLLKPLHIVYLNIYIDEWEEEEIDLKPLHIVYLNLNTTGSLPAQPAETLTYSVFKSPFPSFLRAEVF